MKYTYLDLKTEHIQQFDSLCPLNEFRVICPSEIPNNLLGVVPAGLWEKSDSLLLMSSGSATSTAYCMINCNRWDVKANAIDQEPIFFAHVGGSPVRNGIVVHHGNWLGRTTPVPDEFHEYLKSDGLGNYYPIDSMPDAQSGSLENLGQTTQHGAFDAAFRKITRLSRK